MKTRCFVFLLAILFTNSLDAQFYLKLSLGNDGIYSVKLKADQPLNGDYIVGSGQVTITAPFGGFKVGDLKSISGDWNSTPDFMGKDQFSELNLPHDYFFIGLRDGDGVFPRNLPEEAEITLFTFRNIGYCTGEIELLTAEDPLVTDQNSIQPNHDLTTFDASTASILRISGVYDAGNADCRIGVTPPTLFGGTGPSDDFDNDGIANANDQDDDNDGVRDSADFDPYDPHSDSDGDGITDFVETSGDGTYNNGIDTNPLDDDTDNDLIKDGKEDANHNGIRELGETDPLDDDIDDDGLIDGKEDLNLNCIFDENETDPFNADTDKDGLLDGVEDANKNGIVDNGETDPRNPDSDGDGTIDGEEYAHDLNFKVRLNDAGLYEVLVVSKYNASKIQTLQGKISLVVPSGGFELSDFTAINGRWTYTYLTTPIPERDEDYMIFKLSPRFPDNVLLPSQEVVLFTFKNKGTCTGDVEIYTEERDIVFDDTTYELGLQFSAFVTSPIDDKLDGLFDQGVYDKGSAGCQPDNPEPIESNETDKGFEYQLYQEDGGDFILSAVATGDFNNLSLEKAQVALTFPLGGLGLSDFSPISGEWIFYFLNPEDYNLEDDLVIFKLTETDDAFKTHFKSVSFQKGDVIELLSFRNEATCKGPISVMKEEEVNIELAEGSSFNIFDVVDLNENTSFKYAGVNDVYSVDCPENSMPIDSSGQTDSIFQLTLKQDNSGLFTVYAKSLVDMTSPLLGSAQVTLVSPVGGLVVKDFEFHAGLWENYILDKKDHPLVGDYNIFVSKNTNPLSANNVKAGDEIKLFSFRNSVECLGTIGFISPEFMPSDAIPLNIGINFDVIDLFDNKNYHYLSTYGSTAVDCLDDVTIKGEEDDDDIFTIILGVMEVNVTNRTISSACLEWEPVPNAVSYELQARYKGAAADWGTKAIKTQKTKIYFYAPAEKNYEYRVITYYENGGTIISDIFELPAFSVGLD